MAQVRLAVPAQQFDAAHAVAEIGALNNMRFLEFGMETRPAATGVELAVRIEQGVATARAVIDTLVPALIVLTAEGGLGAGLAHHAVLFGRQFRFPIRIGLVNFGHAVILPKFAGTA